MNILLIGPRGSGKSTVGHLLAQRMRRPFIDLDDRVLEMFPEQSVVEVWATRGEQAWREAEVQSLREALRLDGQIISLGGGVVMIPEARVIINEAKRNRCVKVVYLRCSVSTLLTRLQLKPGDRPPLSPTPWEVEVAEVVAAREPTYLAMADVVADGNQPLDPVTDVLARELA